MAQRKNRLMEKDNKLIGVIRFKGTMVVISEVLGVLQRNYAPASNVDSAKKFF